MKAHAIVLLAAMTILSGCNPDRPLSPRTVTAPSDAASYAVDRFSSDEHMPRTLDQLFLEYGRKIPGFAGLYYDNRGNRTIALKDVRMADQARRALAHAFDRSPSGRGPAAGPIYIHKATYSFAELAGWRRRLHAEAFALPYVTSSDVDELRNRIAIGTLPGSPRGEIMRIAARLDIPAEAVMIEPECVEPTAALRANYKALSMYGAFVSSYATNPCDEGGDDGIESDTAVIGPNDNHTPADLNLQSRFRPVPGGVKIQSGSGTCTAGFNAYLTRYDKLNPGNTGLYDFSAYLVTNAHCTLRLGFNDGGYFSQPIHESVDGQGTFLGQEWRETPWEGTSSYMDCLPFDLCSVADAALVKYAGASPQSGRIARTIGNPCRTIRCPTTIDPFSPTFRIVDSVQNVFGGTQVHKIGVTTGWTSGTVFETCKNVRQLDTNGNQTPFVLLCQTSFDAIIEFVDSSSPVFILRGGSDVSLVGLAWGGSKSPARTRFSDFVYVGYVLTKQDRRVQCPGDNQCWLTLRVSN